LKQFISQHYDRLLSYNGLNTFEGFWNLPVNWVEEPNERRGGWSGVSFYKTSDSNGGSFSMFVKRQENHNYFSPRHPLHVRPTFYRDFSNICFLKQVGIPTVEPVYYGERLFDNRLQAVLATVTLDGYRELNLFFEDPSIKAPMRQAILHCIADILRLMHRHRLRHGSLSGKHVMVKLTEVGSFDARILDLEKMKRSWHHLYASVRDIERFIRHTPTFSKAEHAEFVRHYVKYFDPMQKRLLIRLTNQCIISRTYSKGHAFPLIHLSDLDEATK
jgi:hypothetical protein